MADSPRSFFRRRWRLQFSLLSVFVLMTVSAVAAWYWYQRPFLVDGGNVVVDLCAIPGTRIRNQPGKEVGYVRRVWGGKTLQHGPWRQYDNAGHLLNTGRYRNGERDGEFLYYDAQGTQRGQAIFLRDKYHGPVRHWNESGQLCFEGSYDHGARHGRFDYRDSSGNPSVEAYFDRDVPVGKWTWFLAAVDNPKHPKRPKQREIAGWLTGHWKEGKPSGPWELRAAGDERLLSAEFEGGKLLRTDGVDFSPRLSEALVATADSAPQHLGQIFEFMAIAFEDEPLQDIAMFVAENRRLPLVINARAFEEAGISLESRISFHADLAPLLFSFADLLKQKNLGLDYRYGTLFIDTLESIADWKDRTGALGLVLPPASRLGAELEKETNVDFVEQPLKDVLMYLSDLHRVSIRLSLLPRSQHRTVVDSDAPVTKTLRGISLRNALGIVLSGIDCRISVDGETLVIEPQ